LLYMASISARGSRPIIGASQKPVRLMPWMIGRLPRAEIEAMYGKLAASMVDGTIATPIEASYGLDDVGDALAHAAREHRSGKILLTPNGPIR